MKASSFSVPSLSRLVRIAGIAAMTVALATPVVAQDAASLEELEKQVEQQRVALEEAIANREKTAAKAKTIKERLSESEKRQKLVEEELEALCAEQEELQAGTLESCLNSSDS